MNLDTFNIWFARQSVRDQLILKVGTLVLAVVLLLLLVLLPQRALGRASDTIDDQKQLLDYMRQVGPALAAAGPGTAVQPISESFVVFIDRTAREHGLAEALTGSPAAGNGAFRVSLENADFNLMLTWLHQLAMRHGVRVESASVNGSAEPGRVNASVQLRPPG
jgi:type II secretory pathway component PulM